MPLKSKSKFEIKKLEFSSRLMQMNVIISSRGTSSSSNIVVVVHAAPAYGCLN